METNIPRGLKHPQARFKSYYVVWKLRLGKQIQPYRHWFKSYYVVWKQFYGRSFADDIFRFKSYYVVWKLSIFFHTSTLFSCLNRTMQYGNFFFCCENCAHARSFKSYYVVWKRYTHNCILYFEKSLNRTMQYGNTSDLGAYQKYYLV